MPADNTPATEPLVRIYNKRAHAIDGGKGARAAAASFATVPQRVADAWMKQWPGDIVTAAEAQQEVNGAAAEAAALRDKVAALEKENAALKAKTKKAGADLV